MSLNEAQDKIIEDFSKFTSWEEKYKHLIKLGRELQQFPEEFRLDDNKVSGCQSQVWLFSKIDNKKVIYFADSDAMIVKGLIALLMKIYSNQTPDEILETQPEFFTRIGLDRHLSMNRANGLAAMVKQIKMYALAFKSLQN
ncbi:MAG: SufE family protein [Candidatus Caenarcaniphilales bacterium]|nr:SufE family protein [Candidatus Caenarcaniphilales bacterium]